MPYPILLNHILWIKDILRPDLSPKLLPELIQGRMGTVIPEFHLNRRYLLPFRDKKVYLYVIFPMQIVTVGVEVKPVPVASEHLGHNIFHNHALENLLLIAPGKLGNVVPAKVEDAPLGLIGGSKFFSVLVGQHRLRQSTHQDILPEVVHHLAVERLPQGCLGLKTVAD